MIGQLEGVVWHTGEHGAILGVGGVGYRVFMTEESVKTLAGSGETLVRIWTYLSVREDALDLYGFLDESELVLFEQMISVSGIGPKKALGIISIAPPQTLARAITSNDMAYLTKVSGIGKKMAEKIVLELREKLLGLAGTETSDTLASDADVIAAIQALGYSLHEARSVLKEVPPSAIGVSNRIKAALKILGRQ